MTDEEIDATLDQIEGDDEDIVIAVVDDTDAGPCGAPAITMLAITVGGVEVPQFVMETA